MVGPLWIWWCWLRGLVVSGTSVLLVEHDVDLVMGVCDLVHVLDFGRVICSGRPAEVQGDPAVQKAYLGVAATST
jgi:branched-chain amino acid transport system ATP-binding protein